MFPRISSHSLYHGLRAQLRTTRRRLRHASWNIARSDRRRLLDLRRTAAVNTFLHALEPSKARKVIPLLAGARVFPEAQPREWAASADSSSEGLGNNSGLKTSDFRGIERRKEICWSLGSDSCGESDTLKLD